MARYRTGMETRRRILDATRTVLAERGLEGATLKALCARAGVGAGSFYNLFTSKEEVVLAVVAEAIEAVDPEPHQPERLADLVDAYVAFVTREPVLARIYLQAAVAWGASDPQLAARFRRHHERRVDRFAAALTSGSGEDEARARSELLVAALYGLTVHWILDPSVDLGAQRDRVLALVGVASGPDDRPPQRRALASPGL